MYLQGEIVLVPVPFTDLTSQKRRPVIVISNEFYNQRTTDIVVVAMTSNPLETSYSFTITTSDLVKGQLNRPSKARVGWTERPTGCWTSLRSVQPTLVFKPVRKVSWEACPWWSESEFAEF